MTTPVAAPAVPTAAAPAAPAPAIVPAAPVAPAAPAAAPPAPAAAAPAKTASLIPEDPGTAPAATVPAAPSAPVDPNSPNAWVLSEGVLGEGEKPSWFLADKYKSVAAQAEAYVPLQKRFGAFVGAPADGKYDTKLPEGIGFEIDGVHPLVGEFTKWAASNQLSQQGYSTLLGMLGQYEVAQQPNMADIKVEVGENADARITAVAQWAKANMKPEEFSTFREATSGKNAAAVFKTIEAMVGRQKQIALPKVGGDLPSAQPGGLAAIDAKQAAKGPDGKRLYDTDPKYRAQVEADRVAYFSNQQPQV